MEHEMIAYVVAFKISSEAVCCRIAARVLQMSPYDEDKALQDYTQC